LDWPAAWFDRRAAVAGAVPAADLGGFLDGFLDGFLADFRAPQVVAVADPGGFDRVDPDGSDRAAGRLAAAARWD
jgi:hypothetical protein